MKHDDMPVAPNEEKVQQEDLQSEVRALGDEAFTRRKDRFKRIRTVIQLLILALSAAILINLFFHLKTYHPYDDSAVSAGRIRASLPSHTLVSTASAIRRR